MTIKTGTIVKINQAWDKAKFHTIVNEGVVIGKFHSNYIVNFGNFENRYKDITPYEVTIPEEFLEIVKTPPKNYKHENAPTMNKIEKFTKNLHGSGINYTWIIEETKTAFKISNAYDVMNESGYEIGGADFTITFPKKESMGEFVFKFVGNFAHKMDKKYMLKEYMEDTIANTLDELKFR